ncbi:hypothetical protein ZHAS_00017937 [Anopheles sinensis]|uniref:Uncharacterized protein n=1 Tax=Anopheles sinensis TaxID=74873 RepID=A0A084WHI3_ANOSI|nr:hypothetical protein ZHAS_00017937 [Anopheles sinensis]
MILAFMWREKLHEVAELFIKTSPCLEFERNAIEEGYAPFNFAYQPISEILHDYNQMTRTLHQLVQRYGSKLSFPRSMSDLEKIEYLLDHPSNGTTCTQGNIGQASSFDSTQTASATEQTMTTDQEMFTQFSNEKTYMDAPTMSFMMVASNDGNGTGIGEQESSTTPQVCSTMDNYTVSAADGAMDGGTDGQVATQYVLVDGNGNEQPIMIQILPQSIPEAAAQTNGPVPSMNPAGIASEYPPSSYSVSLAQTEHEMQPPQGQCSVDVPLTVNTGSEALANEIQYHPPAEESTLLTMVSSHQEAMVIEEVVTADCDPGILITQSTYNEAGMLNTNTDDPAGSNVLPTIQPEQEEEHQKSKHAKHKETEPMVMVTTTMNNKKVVTKLKDFRRNIDISKNSKKKGNCCPAGKYCEKGQSDKTGNGKKSAKDMPTFESQPTASTEVSQGDPTTIDPTVSGIEEWQRIRSVNRNNFDNVVRQVISKDMDQLQQEKKFRCAKKGKRPFKCRG